jgi:hypothetical protein
VVVQEPPCLIALEVRAEAQASIFHERLAMGADLALLEGRLILRKKRWMKMVRSLHLIV